LRRADPLQPLARGGGGRPRRLAVADAPLRRPAATRPGPRRLDDLRLLLVLQQLRGQLLHRRLRTDLPGLGLLGPPPLAQPADGERDLDRDRRRPGGVGDGRLAVDEVPVARGEGRGARRRDGGRDALMEAATVGRPAGSGRSPWRRLIPTFGFMTLPTALL